MRSYAKDSNFVKVTQLIFGDKGTKIKRHFARTTTRVEKCADEDFGFSFLVALKSVLLYNVKLIRAIILEIYGRTIAL